MYDHDGGAHHYRLTGDQLLDLKAAQLAARSVLEFISAVLAQAEQHRHDDGTVVDLRTIAN